jgi:hypothetical protein
MNCGQIDLKSRDKYNWTRFDLESLNDILNTIFGKRVYLQHSAVVILEVRTKLLFYIQKFFGLKQNRGERPCVTEGSAECEI